MDSNERRPSPQNLLPRRNPTRRRAGPFRTLVLLSVLATLVLGGGWAIGSPSSTATKVAHTPYASSSVALVTPAVVSANSTLGWSRVGNPWSVAPSIRDMAPMAYDPALGKVVLFGGYDPNVVALGDTWTYGNGNWTRVDTIASASPPPRWHSQLVWDGADHSLLLFGGRNVTQFFNDTWSFNGTGWARVTTTTGAEEPTAG